MSFPSEPPLVQTEFFGLAGTTTADGATVRDGRLYYDVSNSRWQFEGVIEGSGGQGLLDEEFEMKLEDEAGRSLVCSKCIISGIQSHLFDLEIKRGKPVHIVVGGAELSKGAIGGGDEVRVYGAVEIGSFMGDYQTAGGINRVDLSFMEPGAGLVPQGVEELGTGGVFSYPVKGYDQEEAFQIRDKLTFLLSFADGRRVRCPYLLVWGGEDCYVLHLLNPPRQILNAGVGGVIRTVYPGRLENFLRRAWTAWDRHNSQLDLPHLIDYYLLALDQQFAAPRMLIASVWMEAMKFQYATGVMGYTRKKPGAKFNKPGKKETYDFGELVAEIYDHYDVRDANGNVDGDTGFITYRNEVVHEGRLDSVDLERRVELSDNLLWTIQRLMLNILGYRGEVYSRIAGDYIDYPPRPALTQPDGIPVAG